MEGGGGSRRGTNIIYSRRNTFGPITKFFIPSMTYLCPVMTSCENMLLVELHGGGRITTQLLCSRVGSHLSVCPEKTTHNAFKTPKEVYS